jgi:uncharacterized protein (DUF1919 family)
MIHPDLINQLENIDIFYIEKRLAINQTQPSFIQFEYIFSDLSATVSNVRFHVNIKSSFNEIVKAAFEAVQEASHKKGEIIGRNDIRHRLNKLLEIED